MHEKTYTNEWNGLELGYFPFTRVWEISLLYFKFGFILFLWVSTILKHFLNFIPKCTELSSESKSKLILVSTPETQTQYTLYFWVKCLITYHFRRTVPGFEHFKRELTINNVFSLIHFI